jgi:thiosulfate/3-mercaptopyruvate sulfurtransferase
MGPFIDAAFVREHLNAITVCHVGWGVDGAPGDAGYLAGHIPGALYVDLDRDVAAPATTAGGRHPLPDPATWAATLGRLGFDRARQVVAYDDGVGGIAARLVWMLRATGFDAAVLDGGLEGWGTPRAQERAVTNPTLVPLRPFPKQLLVGIDDVLDAPLLLDARDAARYRGDSAGPDARAGHIPGAVSVPFTDNLDEHGLLRPDDELAAIYDPLLAGGVTAVASCGSGVTACHDLLVLDHLGHGPGQLFVGSWSAWAASRLRRITVGNQP